MSTWEERMAAGAAERRITADAAEAAREAEEYARLVAEGLPLPLDGEFGPVLDGPHRGHWEHAHSSHYGVVCQCGETRQAGSLFLTGAPGPCPVCAARGISLPG